MFNQMFGEDAGKNVAKWASVSLILLSAFLLVKVLSDLKRLPSIGREIYPQSTIMVTGSGEAFAIPDIASFSFSVTESSEDAESAQKLLDTKIASAHKVLLDLGVEEKDIKTVGYNVYPKYEWEQVYCIQMVGAVCPPGKNKLVGYEVSQTISVKVREVDQAGDLVNKVGAVGVSNISGVEFTVDDREKFVAEAREQAIAEAKDQAKVLAKELGVSLGKILYYNDNQGGYPMPYYGGEMDMARSAVAQSAPMKADLPMGETKITSNISITYEIK